MLLEISVCLSCVWNMYMNDDRAMSSLTRNRGHLGRRPSSLLVTVSTGI